MKVHLTAINVDIETQMLFVLHFQEILTCVMFTTKSSLSES